MITAHTYSALLAHYSRMHECSAMFIVPQLVPMLLQGRAEILAMQDMIYGLESNMRLLVASVRSTEDIVALASQVMPLH